MAGDEFGVCVALHALCSIGRSSKNSLVLDHPAVSRRHALIHAQGNERWLVDLGSSNGVQLNQRRVRLPVRLKDQ
ncbi:MAG: FHA domain-containing protein, partial [Verrucomicrobia bacterium]|nr:FHA domain-containing protein [Verrucomicrobiota bacterium]